METEGTFTGDGSYKLCYRRWYNRQVGTKAVLVLAHGLAEHCGRYQNFIDYFLPRGYEIWAFDYRGHGKSEGKRCHVEKFDYFVQDTCSFLQIVAQQRPDVPVFLVGHSMGGLVAALVAFRCQDKLRGLVLSAPSLKRSIAAPEPLKTVVRMLSAVAPKVGVHTIDSSLLSRDFSVVQVYDSDPLVFRGKISARLASELVNAGEAASKQAHLIKLPVLILHGVADKLCNPAGSKLFYQECASADKTLKLYDGCYHEIFNEPCKEQVFRDIEEWVEKHSDTIHTSNKYQ